MSKELIGNREIEFKLVGRNRKFNKICISDALTIQDIADGGYPSFFGPGNRHPEIGNCDFIAEILYTGLKDKNGVKIYEFNEINNKYRVVFISPSFVLQDITSGDIVCIDENIKNELKITREYCPMEENEKRASY